MKQLGSVLTLICLVVLGIWYFGGRQNSKALCVENLTLLSAALDEYSAEHEGHYPAELKNLVPDHLPLLPRCPLDAGYSYTVTDDGYRLVCRGQHSPGLAYDSVSGFGYVSSPPTELESPASAPLQEAKIVKLASHRLTEVPAEVTQMDTVVRLDLSHNQLRGLPDLSAMGGLRLLSLHSNRFSEFPLQLTQAPLTQLLLQHNSLVELPAEVGAMTRLRVLGLSFNRLSEGGLADIFDGMVALEVLSLRHNQLESEHLPASLWRSKSLKTLRLSHNRIDRLPKDLSGLTSLRTLELEGNPIDELELERVRLALPHAQIVF